MNLRLILPVSAAILFAASCTPYVEPPPEAPTDPAARKPTPEEQAKIKEQREKKKKEGEDTTKTEDTTPGGEPTEPKTTPPGDSTEPKKPEKVEYKVAKPVPGKTGFVFSPFNNKVIDVKDIPSGRLVADPTYPASEKKYFRVP